ncbi:MAG TPA: MBL fold metallo-hydrolase [Fontimonas sp.]
MHPPRLLLLALLLCVTPALAAAPPIIELDGGIRVLAGRFVPGSQPDGNTVVLEGSDGVIVFDTGRHLEHTQAVADLAQRLDKPLAAIVNSHWHLDHVGGNVLLRQRYPQAKVYASDAIAAAQVGFLASYRSQLQQALATESDPAQRSAFEAEIALIDAGKQLEPDHVLEDAVVERRIGGRDLRLGLVRGAATAGDVWLLDVQTRTLASGDLVTLPVPLLDTACPSGFAAGLAELAKIDFSTLVPGHGAPMQRAQFERYQRAYRKLLTCAASDRSNAQCGSAWLSDVGDLVPDAEHAFAQRLLDYYLEQVLRPGAPGAGKYCN